MTGDHYFSADPAAPLERRRIVARIAGRDLELASANGVFSSEHLDRGTEVLLSEVPDPPAAGTALDLGCGWGPIALELALRSPQLTVWAVDVNERALALCAENAEAHAPGRVHPALPDGVPADVRFDVIWSNPPIRIGKAQLHALLERWLPRLAVDGEAWLVVAKQLGADSLQRWIADRFGPALEIERAATAKGFRVLRIVRIADEPRDRTRLG